MHIPDGFLSTPVWATLNVVSLPALAYVAKRAQSRPEIVHPPLLGVMGAFVFAAQMINFPVAPGVSAHILGGALLACTLGPLAAAVVMSAVLIVQAFLFQDGGVLALGANIFNLAFAGVIAAYLPYLAIGSRWRLLGIGLGAFFSVLVSSALVLMELSVSGLPLPAAVANFSLQLFALSALIEALISVFVVRAVEKINPGWIQEPSRAGARAVRWLAASAAILALLAFALASTFPDTLEDLAIRGGWDSRAVTLWRAPLPDYAMEGFGALGNMLAATAGLAAVFGASVLCARLLRRAG
jgi:cobalt/nickel transport system permease protein